ncbi:MAG TPA: YdeI/OmpD-associated family protein [Terriglobia bacterium]|nr:YdeI/OmpD-associated family protein [Terriglobia bacterium]
MNSTDPRIDAYIEKSADFAKPILNHIRELVHFACPQVEETMKWGFPHFMYKGILCSMASFKQHCAVGFWKGALVFQAIPGVKKREETAMGHLGRITTIADLPDRNTLTHCIIEAVRLNETGTKLPRKPKLLRKELVVPDDLAAALKKNKKALATFARFTYSHRKEYIQWISGAKTEATRAKRLKTALDWMAEGKSRHWKYENC